MTLNDWSLVYFAITAIYTFAVYVSLFTNLTIGKMFFVILAWLAHVSVTLTYGIATQQIGFIFLFGLELMTITLIFISIGRSNNANSNS